MAREVVRRSEMQVKRVLFEIVVWIVVAACLALMLYMFGTLWRDR